MDKVLRNTAATISVTFYNGSTAVEADGAVTVVAKRADGTTLFSTAATNEAEVGVYSVVIPPQANLNVLTITWTGTFTGTPISIQSNVEIVGGFYFSIAELKAMDSQFTSNPRYTNDVLAEARDEVEAEFEDICHRSFVPRFWREVGVEQDPDTSMLWLEKPEFIRINSLTVYNVDQTAWYSSGYLTRDKYSPRGVQVTQAAVGLFVYPPVYYPSGVVIEYEYGLPIVPLPIKKKALKRAKGNLLGQKSTIDERATTMTLPDIGTVNLATPGVRGSETGIPDIDVVLSRYTIDGGAGVF